MRWLALHAGIMVMMLGGCGSSDGANAPQHTQAVGIMPATSQPPITTGIAPDPLQSAANEYADSEPPIRIMTGFDDNQPPRYFDVIDCQEFMRVSDPGGIQPTPAELIARRVALLRRSLTVAGYRPEVFQQPLANYAVQAQRTAAVPVDPEAEMEPEQRDLTALAIALEANRARLQPQMPPVRAEGGCGADEQPVLVRSDPPGAHIWLITKFAFDVCRARRIDAWDMNACTRWTELDPLRPAQLSGNYMYQARWPGGRAAKGMERIDPSTGGDSDTTQTVVVHGA